MNALAPYPADYFIQHDYGLDEQRSEMYKQERARILAIKQQGVILDIGCGTGDFLAGFNDNWRKFGIEPSEYAARQAIGKGLSMLNDIETIGAKMFDVIVFRGTIQHIDEPFAMIRKAIKALKPDGILIFLATPNADSICYRLFGDLPALDWPLNFWIPGYKTLDNALTNLGMAVIKVEYPYWRTPYARPLRDVWRFIGRLFGVRSKFPFPGNMMEVYAVKS